MSTNALGPKYAWALNFDAFNATTNHVRECLIWDHLMRSCNHSYKVQLEVWKQNDAM